MRRLLVTSISAFILTACSVYPLGMSESEWEQLTPEQQLDARERQERLDMRERQRRAEATHMRAEQERLAQVQYEDARQNASHGDIVECMLRDAEGYYAGNWRSAEPIGFSLLRGFDEDVSIAEQGRPTRRVTTTMTFNGANIQICRTNDRDCVNFAATQNQLRRGVSQPIHVNRTVRGTLYCDVPAPIRNVRGNVH